MEENRVPVYGTDAEGKPKRGFDLLEIDGKTFVESVIRDGRKVKIPLEAARAALRQLHHHRK